MSSPVSRWWTMSLPPHLSLKKALRSSEAARGSAGQTRRGAGSQLCRCLPWQSALGWALSRLLPQVRAVRVHWRLCQPVPMQCLDRCGLHPFVCFDSSASAVLLVQATCTAASVPSAQLPCPLLHSCSAPCCLSSPMLPPTCCAPAPLI